MCTGIALTASELPVELVRRHRLAERAYDRHGQPEYQFHFWQQPTVLPVRWQGRLDVLPWGSKVRGGRLPYGHGVAAEHLRGGALGAARLDVVVVPANMLCDRGVWLVVTEGLRGVAVHTPAGPVVYLLLEPADNYYRNATGQAPLMPVLVNQVI